MSQVKVTNKKSGITYVYESESYWEVLVNQCVDIDSKHYQLVVTNILYTMPITVPANCA